MEKLISENMSVSSLDEAYALIKKYADCRDKLELDFCKNTVLNLYPQVLINQGDPKVYELERAMERLVSEHVANLDTIEDAYAIISHYYDCKEKWELNYCKELVRKKYSARYYHWDGKIS